MSVKKLVLKRIVDKRRVFKIVRVFYWGTYLPNLNIIVLLLLFLSLLLVIICFYFWRFHDTGQTLILIDMASVDPSEAFAEKWSEWTFI